jgi:hypothetical protein
LIDLHWFISARHWWISAKPGSHVSPGVVYALITYSTQCVSFGRVQNHVGIGSCV